MDSLGWVLFLVLLGLVAAAYFKLRGGAANENGPWPVFAKKPLSAPQQLLYFRLVKALPEHIVLAQVPMSRFLGVKGSKNVHAWNNRIHRLGVDFVVCAKDARVLAVVELDDAAHKSAEQLRTDEKKSRALESAGVRMIRWQARSLPDEAAIRTELYSQAQPSAGSMTPARSPAEGRGVGLGVTAKAHAGRSV